MVAKQTEKTIYRTVDKNTLKTHVTRLTQKACDVQLHWCVKNRLQILNRL